MPVLKSHPPTQSRTQYRRIPCLGRRWGTQVIATVRVVTVTLNLSGRNQKPLSVLSTPGENVVALDFDLGRVVRAKMRSPFSPRGVPRLLGEAFEDIARANGITKAELLRRLIQALVEKMKTGR